MSGSIRAIGVIRVPPREAVACLGDSVVGGYRIGVMDWSDRVSKISIGVLGRVQRCSVEFYVMDKCVVAYVPVCCPVKASGPGIEVSHATSASSYM